MEYRLLGYTTPDISPEARWFLLQWSKSYGLDRAVFGPRLDLYKRLGVSPKAAKRGLDLLEEHGHVISETHPQKRGRPTTGFCVSPRFLRQLKTCTTPTTAHQPEIDELCRHAIRVRNESTQNPLSEDHRANRLTPATYYLLAVLLAHAEIPGIVRNVSYWWLQMVTGMTKDRVISQLSKLKRIGVITHHEPGILRNGGKARMRSVYNLNLNHPLLLGEDATGLTAVVCPKAKPGSFTFLSGAYDAALVAIKLAENETKILKEIETIASSERQEEQEEQEEQERQRARRYRLGV
jgi:hypothetical protein